MPTGKTKTNPKQPVELAILPVAFFAWLGNNRIMTAKRLQALKTRLGINTITTRYRHGVWCTTCEGNSPPSRASDESLEDSIKYAIGLYAIYKANTDQYFAVKPITM